MFKINTKQTQKIIDLMAVPFKENANHLHNLLVLKLKTILFVSTFPFLSVLCLKY